MRIHLVEPVKELRENLRAKDDSQGGSNGRRNRVPSAHPVPKPKRVLRVDPKVGNAVQCRRHGDKVLGNRFCAFAESGPSITPSSVRLSRNHWRTTRAFVMVSSVVKVLEVTTTNVA